MSSSAATRLARRASLRIPEVNLLGLLIILLAASALGGCAALATTGDAPVEPDRLRQSLESQVFLERLGTDQFVILRRYPHRIVIQTLGERQRIWEMVYLIDEGWRLKGEDERLILIPGQGYAPAPK